MKVSRRIILAPPFVFSFVGFTSFITGLFFFDAKFGPAFYLFFIGLLFFTLGFLFFYNKSDNSFNFNLDFKVAPRWVVLIYWFMSFVGLALSIRTIYVYGVLGSLDGLFLNLRYEKSYGESSYLGAQHLSLFALALGFYYAAHKMFFKFIFVCMVFLISAISIAERTSILFGFSSILYFLFFLRYIGFKVVFISLFVIMALFVIIAVSAGKTGGGGVFSFIPAYFSYSFIAFDEYVYGREFQGCLRYVFGTVGDIIDPDGCSATKDLHTDTRHNVYTYVSSPYLLMGPIGVPLLMLFVGVWYGFLWKFASRFSGYFLVVLSCYIYGVIMVFYAWQFSNTTYIYMIILAAPLFLKFKTR